jgi:peptidyl-prolyl cis-trans isomerase B (cyclophilin B)
VPKETDKVVTSKTRRRREFAAARIARQAERRAAARRRRRLTAGIAAGVVVVLGGTIAGVLLLTGTNNDTATLAQSASPSPSATPSAAPTSTAAPASTKVGPCTYTSDGRDPSRPVALPAAAGSVDRSPATMAINTGKGTITAALDAQKAPCTVHALLTMAQAKYFDNTPCHRETAANIFVLQCGDPTATSQGGPGFTYANENTDGATYTRGVIAMANGGADTNGSQFFLIYKDPNSEGVRALGNKYTIVGRITGGLDVLDALTSPGIEGGSPDGAPVSKAQITTLTVTQAA